MERERRGCRNRRFISLSQNSEMGVKDASPNLKLDPCLLELGRKGA